MSELALFDNLLLFPELHLRRKSPKADSIGIGTMRCDFIESPDRYVMHADLPGFKKDDIHINLDNGVLTLEASKGEEKVEEKANYYHRERSWGKVQRSFRLPRDANQDAAQVKYVDGVLTIEFPKQAVSGAKKLTIA